MSEDIIEEVASEKTLDDIYSAIMDLSSNVSGLSEQVSILQEKVTGLQELLTEKFDMLLEKFQVIPQYEQMDVIIAFLLILVVFEFMRLIKSWTSSFRMRGGS